MKTQLGQRLETANFDKNIPHQSMLATRLSALTSNKSFVLRATTQVWVTPKNGNAFIVKVLLDNGSQTCLIAQSLADCLKYKTYDNNFWHFE